MASFGNKVESNSLGLVGIEAGDGYNLGSPPWSAGHRGWALLPKVFAETSVHCAREKK